MKTVQLTENEYGFARVLISQALEEEKAKLDSYKKEPESEAITRLIELKEIKVSAIQTLMSSMFKESE